MGERRGTRSLLRLGFSAHCNVLVTVTGLSGRTSSDSDSDSNATGQRSQWAGDSLQLCVEKSAGMFTLTTAEALNSQHFKNISH